MRYDAFCFRVAIACRCVVAFCGAPQEHLSSGAQKLKTFAQREKRDIRPLRNIPLHPKYRLERQRISLQRRPHGFGGVQLLYAGQQPSPVLLVHRRKKNHGALSPRRTLHFAVVIGGDDSLQGAGPLPARPGKQACNGLRVSRMSQHQHVNPPGWRIGQKYLGLGVRDYTRPVE
jgi:hypothetical protein